VELTLEALVLLLDVGLGIAALVLVIFFLGSAFSSVPRYMLLLAFSLTVHAITHIVVPGKFGFFLYGFTAVVASLSYLLLVYGVFVTLKNISEREDTQ